jgi:hypothetical protein
MAPREMTPRARRSGAVPVCAVYVAVFGGIALTACLNPMPEEFPSERDKPPPTAPAEGLGVGAAGASNAGTASGGAAGGASGVSGDSPSPTSGPPESQAPGGNPSGDPPDAGGDAAIPSNTVTDTAP